MIKVADPGFVTTSDTFPPQAPTAPAPAPQSGRRTVRTGIYLLVVLTAGAYLPSPLLPAYQGAFGLTDLGTTLLFATFALVSAPALLVFGQASDALGPRPVLRASIAAAAVGSLCFLLADSAAWLTAGRVAQGAAMGAATTAAGVLIARNTLGGPGRAALLTGAAFLTGTAAGPFAAGVLAEYAPAPTAVPFASHLALLAIGWLRLRRPHRTLRSAPEGAGLRHWRPVRPRIPRGIRAVFATAAMSGFLAWAAAGLFLAVLPSLLAGEGLGGPAATGTVLAAVLACSVAMQPIVRRAAARDAQLAGLAALGAGLLLLTAAGGASLTAVLAAALLAGAGHGLAYGGAAAAVDAVAPEHQRGAVTGALYVFFYLGSGLPAVAVGALALWLPLGTALAFGAAAGAACTVPCAAAVLRTGARP